MTNMHWVMAGVLAVSACKKTEPDGNQLAKELGSELRAFGNDIKSGIAQAKEMDKETNGGLPALTADPDPGTITPADHPPLESVKLRMLAVRGDKGWPKWSAYNLGTKPITFIGINGYAYDKDGKLVKVSNSMNWNGTLAPATKSSDLSIQSSDPVPTTAVAFETCVFSLKREGDADSTTEFKRCPSDKPKDK